jgi:phosphatidylserine decarboxylase
MSEIRYIDRTTRKEEVEQVYGKVFLDILYGHNPFHRILSAVLLPLSKISLFSQLYGAFQKSCFSRYKIRPFIDAFRVDETEFLDPVSSYRSFNDFFIRKLKPSARPLAHGSDVAVLPADGRYLVYQNIEQANGFLVKGHKFSLRELLKSDQLAKRYAQGAMVIARLCPTDYHRFHFPCSCEPEKAQLINGPLYSVNPIALKQNIDILSQNKRVITQLNTKQFGTVLYIEVGATNVGSIVQTYTPNEHYDKGDEKGYFSFGGSCLILLFEPSRIQLDQDLIEVSERKLETRGLLGQPLGRAIK